RKAASQLGVTLRFQGRGGDEQGVLESVIGDAAPTVRPGYVIVAVDPRYFRPAEVETLLGNPAKAKEKLGWVPEITPDQMVEEMVARDLEESRRHAFLMTHGYDVRVSRED